LTDPPKPTLFLFIGMDYLFMDINECPPHYQEIRKYAINSILKSQRKIIKTPMVILKVPKATDDLSFKKKVFIQPNHLVIEDESIDKILQNIIGDLKISDEINSYNNVDPFSKKIDSYI